MDKMAEEKVGAVMGVVVLVVVVWGLGVEEMVVVGREVVVLVGEEKVEEGRAVSLTLLRNTGKMATGCQLNVHVSQMCCHELAHWQATAMSARPLPAPQCYASFRHH